MKIVTRSSYYYLSVGFGFGFAVSLVGMTLEDYMHDISLVSALTEANHFFAPIALGLLTSLFAFFYRRNKLKQVEAINQFTENLRSHIEINSALISTIEINKVLQIIIDKATQIINLDTGAIYLHEKERLYLGATTPPLPENFPDVLRYDELIHHPHIQKALNTQQPVAIYDVTNESLTDAEQIVVKARNLISILYIPLIIENRPVGTLILGSTSKIRNFSKQEIDIYKTFSGQAALAIENARLYNNSLYIANELRQQNDEFLTLNEELSENNKRIYEMNESLKVAVEKAEESDRLKSAFLNNITHEIRTPLNAIVGFSNIINDLELTGDKIKTFTKTIADSSNQLLNIVDDVLEISLIQAKSSSIVNTEFDVINLLKRLIDDFQQTYSNIDVDFKAIFNSKYESYTIHSDKSKITAIVKHLLDNARKFTVKGYINFRLDINSDQIVIEVADTGIGIPKDLQDIVFEPFRQVEVGNSRMFGGNGLGLAIVKASVQMLNGSLTLNSEVGEGTTVRLTLPSVPLSVEDEKRLFNYNNCYPSKTILIAEDEYSNYFYLSELLTDSKVNILHASNGQEAIDIFQKHHNIDIILMDLKMPIIDGLSAAKHIKQLNSKIPIVAQTAYTLNINDQPVDDFRFDEIINKPLKKELLFEILNKYLNSV